MRALLLACALAPASGCASPTAEACERYVEAFRALPCAEGLEPGLDCRAYDGYPCDASSYFDCAVEHKRCEGGELIDGLDACVEHLTCSDAP